MLAAAAGASRPHQLVALFLTALLLAASERADISRAMLLVRRAPQPPHPKITLVVQTYVGDRARFEGSLGPSLRAFFDARAAALHFVLDDDDLNRAWAVELGDAFPNATFAFAPEPPSAVMDAASVPLAPRPPCRLALRLARLHADALRLLFLRRASSSSRGWLARRRRGGGRH